jgi:hypothetical protein
VQKNPQVIDSPFDESAEVLNITKSTRSNRGLLEHFSTAAWPWGATISDSSTRAREVLEHLTRVEIRMARERQRWNERCADIENGADHLP